MADFSPPFGSVGGVNRSPTVDEQNDGFPCGDADMTLFNRLFGRIEAEMKAVQDAGGIAGSEGDDTTVLQAIQALISAATGGGDTSQYVLFSQAQARLPIFPEVTTNNGVIAVTAPSTGTIRVPASATILHRGIRTYTTAETDLSTTVSKTYHLRWNPADGFTLKDLADTGYNPTVAAETNAAFDSSYDDMLVARVVTNSSNVATISNLTNRAQLWLDYSATQTSGSVIEPGAGSFALAFRNIGIPIGWGRAPKFKALDAVVAATIVPPPGVLGGANQTAINSISRYSLNFDAVTDYGASVSLPRLVIKAAFGA